MDRKIIYRLAKLNPVAYLIFFFIVLMFVQLPFLLIDTDLQNSSFEKIKSELGLTGIFVIAVFLAPIIETLIYQIVIIEGCRYFLRKFISLRFICAFSIMISSFAFAFDHTYSVYYFIGALCTGIVFAVVYIISKYRKEPAFIFPLFLHAFWNLFVFVIDDL